MLVHRYLFPIQEQAAAAAKKKQKGAKKKKSSSKGPKLRGARHSEL